MFDAENHFVDGVELGVVGLYLVDCASTDPFELKTGRNGEEGNPLVKGSRLLLRTLSKMSQ